MTGAPEIILRARRAAEAYAAVSEFECPKEFLAVLTDVLDDLAEAFSYPLPDFEEAFGR